MRSLAALLASTLAACALAAHALDLPRNEKVEGQPLAAQAQRVMEALDYLGSPLTGDQKSQLEQAITARDVVAIQKALDPLCLAAVRVAKDGKLEALAGPAKPELMEQGWRIFLVKVLNEGERAGLELRPESPNAQPLHVRSSSSAAPTVTSVGEVGTRFLDLEFFRQQPLLPTLSGLEVEYKVLQVYCRDAGRREAKLGFSLHESPTRPQRGAERPQRSQPAATRSNSLDYVFTSAPAVLVKLNVKDHDGEPVMASFLIRDRQGRVYPSMARRLAPDFFFHAQIYRNDGETVTLPPGNYQVTYVRGPEYLTLTKDIVVPDSPTHAESFKLERWIHCAAKSWYSGDHHVHAAGCAHYESPTEGVTPADMMRHILGEDLNVGCVLSWGPCWYHQKRYFEGAVHRLSRPNYLMRYDVEVSGFPSSHCGHICLLRLREQDYPGTKLIEDWPSWDLPIFRWAKAQGGVVGFAHSGWGLEPENGDPAIRELPNYLIPRMAGIGANEYLVDVAHDACDFISTVDTPSVWELNIWYHTLNCGYRCRISGETDFPCIYGERVGLGRSYVCMDGKKLNFDDWAEGIKQGRSYVTDGRSHLLDFTVNDLGVGMKGSEVKLATPGKVKVKATVAALLAPHPTPETERIRNTPLHQKPYWDLERARIGSGRTVPVEVVVNGLPVAKKEIAADGTQQDVEFEVPIEISSWVCLRIFPSSHTNPVFVLVDDKPIRASKRSAEWCLKGIDNCWKQKSPQIRAAERPTARAAYHDAIAKYRQILSECVRD